MCERRQVHLYRCLSSIVSHQHASPHPPAAGAVSGSGLAEMVLRLPDRLAAGDPGVMAATSHTPTHPAGSCLALRAIAPKGGYEYHLSFAPRRQHLQPICVLHPSAPPSPKRDFIIVEPLKKYKPPETKSLTLFHSQGPLRVGVESYLNPGLIRCQNQPRIV